MAVAARSAPSESAFGRRLRTLGHSRLAAAAAYVVGAPSAAVGAGIGIRFLTTTGITPTSLGGVTLMLVGLLLLGFAVTVMWRTTRRWQRLWLVPLAVVTLLLGSSVSFGAVLAYAPRNELGAVTPADRGLAFRDVAFRTSDGVLLSGWYVPSHNQAAVVTLPGSGSNRTSTLGQAVVLARHGYGVLLVDPSGQGRSGGRAMDAGWYGDRDVTAAVNFLVHRHGVDPGRIGVLGLSMGGEEAIGAAAADPAIRAVVAEGATHRTAADKAGYLPGGIPGAIQRVLDQVTYGTAALLSPAPEPGSLHDAIARAHGTHFLLIAGGDVVDEADAAAYLRSAAPERVVTWTVAGASHTHGLATAPAAWTARVIGFLNATLRPHPATAGAR